jgi:hypothetical protein
MKWNGAVFFFRREQTHDVIQKAKLFFISVIVCNAYHQQLIQGLGQLAYLVRTV